MIIKQIRIFNYGKWHDVTIPLRKGLNILYGPNESGKTTLLSFIRGVLFGYLQRRTSHKNYILSKSKNYGGQLELTADGHNYIVQRMAGKNGGPLMILNDHGDKLDNSVLKKILGPFDRNTFDALYYFGTVNLQKVSKLKQRDLIYRIQRIGLAHSNDWIDYRESLNKDAKGLYSPRGYKPPLNQKLKQYSRLIDQIKDAKLGYTTYQRLLKSIHEYHHDQQLVKSQLNQQRDYAAQINNDRNIWLQYQKLTALKPVMGKSILSGFTDKDAGQLQSLIRQLTHSQNHVKLIKQQINESSSQMINDDTTHFYNQHLGMIRKLANQFNDVQRQIHKLSLLNDKNDDVRKQLAQLRNEYTINGRLLKPMTKEDLQVAQNLQTKLIKIQKAFQDLSHKLIKLQTSKQFRTKDYVIIGIAAALIILGAGGKIWLMSCVGIIILILGFISSIIKGNHTNSKQVQIKLKQTKATNVNFHNQLHFIQIKYHYQSSNADEWIANQDNLHQLQRLITNAQSLDKQIHQVNRWIHNYFTKWSFINHELTLSTGSADKLLQLKTYVNKMDQTTKINHQADKQRQMYQHQLRDANTNQQMIQDTLNRFYRDRHVKNVDDFNHQQKEQAKLNQQQSSYRALSKQIGDQELTALKQYKSFDDLKNQMSDINQKIYNIKSRQQTITRQLTAAQVKLDHLVHNGSYDQLQQRVANARTEINSLVTRWLEEVLASQWINAALNLATKGRVPKIEQQAQLNFWTLTNHHYVSIIFNKTQIKVMRNDKQRFTLYELSKGTVQQLYLALIFAMAQVFGTDYPMPIMIDDGFTDFDVTRRKAAVNLLKQLSDKLQVIYCTSDENFSKDQNVLKLDQVK